MSHEDLAPLSFQQTLAEIYTNGIDARCHQADRIFEVAKLCVWNRTERFKTPTGFRVWKSTSEYVGLLDDVEIGYSLMAPRGKFGQIPRALAHKKQINLAINNQWGHPAAIILPPHIEHSAAIVVGSCVNEPQHLNEIELIVGIINENSHDMVGA